MSKETVVSPKIWCRLNTGGGAEQCERALKMANELPDPLRLNRMVPAPIIRFEELVAQGFLKEVRPRVFKFTGKGRDEEEANWDF